MSMYVLCGVVRPAPDIAGLKSLASAYEEATHGFLNAHQELSGAISHVMSNNEGQAAAAFEANVAGGAGILPHLQELTEAGARSATAYGTAAVGAESTQVAMDTVAKLTAQILHRALLAGNRTVALLVVNFARERLVALQGEGTTAIQSAFSGLNLPAPFQISYEDKYGHLDPGIEDEWRKLVAEDPEKAKAILQKMADEYADAHGIPRVKIEFAVLDENTNGARYPDGTIKLNLTHLDNPRLIGTVIHEMEHSRQYYGMDEKGPGGTDVGGGMTPEEAARWRQLNENSVRNKGSDGYDNNGDESYTPRPVEVGARQSGRDHVNNMTYEEFMEYVN